MAIIDLEASVVQNIRLVGSTLKVILFQTLPQAGTTATRPGGSEPCPVWPWTFPIYTYFLAHSKALAKSKVLFVNILIFCVHKISMSVTVARKLHFQKLTAFLNTILFKH